MYADAHSQPSLAVCWRLSFFVTFLELYSLVSYHVCFMQYASFALMFPIQWPDVSLGSILDAVHFCCAPCLLSIMIFDDLELHSWTYSFFEIAIGGHSSTTLPIAR